MMTTLALFFPIFVSYFFLIHCDILNLTENIDSAIKDENVYVIKFYSEMCGSCKEFAPIFNEYAKKIDKKLKVGMVNIDNKKGMESATKIGAMDGGIPSVLLMKTNSNNGILPIFDGDGDLPTASSMLRKTRSLVQDLDTNNDGKYIKK